MCSGAVGASYGDCRQDDEEFQALVNKLLECRRKVFKKNKALKDEILKDIEARFE